MQQPNRLCDVFKKKHLLVRNSSLEFGHRHTSAPFCLSIGVEETQHNLRPCETFEPSLAPSNCHLLVFGQHLSFWYAVLRTVWIVCEEGTRSGWAGSGRFCLRPVNSSRIATLDTSPLSYLPPTKTISSSLPAIYSSLVAVNVLSGRLGWMRQSSSCGCLCCKLCLRTLE
ncbi:hypothetical protein V9T40_007057 [Parthenolecanium corni]|uniref:Uncharacterized protein n=1 Tax=Parthenolecanium corni TaxID=536013 RepID=A0AAN9TTV0_9HEMI